MISKILLLEGVENTEQIKPAPNHKNVDNVHYNQNETKSVINTIDEFLNLNKKRHDHMDFSQPLVQDPQTDHDLEIIVVDQGDQTSCTVQNVWKRGIFLQRGIFWNFI